MLPSYTSPTALSPALGVAGGVSTEAQGRGVARAAARVGSSSSSELLEEEEEGEQGAGTFDEWEPSGEVGRGGGWVEAAGMAGRGLAATLPATPFGVDPVAVRAGATDAGFKAPPAVFEAALTGFVMVAAGLGETPCMVPGLSALDLHATDG